MTGRADNLARALADSRAAQSRMARELADSPVTYRGTRMAAREAVITLGWPLSCASRL